MILSILCAMCIYKQNIIYKLKNKKNFSFSFIIDETEVKQF